MFAVIFIPNFFLQAALRHEPELYSRPVALLDEKLKVIFQVTSSAQDAGVGAGLTSTQALARCANVLIRARSVPQEEAAMNVLLECAYAFSPSIEATAPGVCTMDLQKLSKAGDKPWAEKILQQLGSFQLRGQIGIAENPDLALHAAKVARPVFVVEDSTGFLSSLPVESVDPPENVLNLLHRWGIHTLGEFTALQKNNLAERLGAEALELFDRAAAKDIRPLNLVRPREVFEENIDFENEIETLEALLFILRRFLEQLSRRLELFHFVAEEIELQLTLSSGEKYKHSFRVPSPTRNIETLFRMLHTHLEMIRTECPIVALQLSIKPGRSEQFQFGLFEAALRDPNQFYETLTQLTSLLGSDRVGTPLVENSFRPDVFRMEAVDFETEGHEIAENVSGTLAIGLELRRFRPPLPTAIELHEGRPASLHCEKFAGDIINANGPFRSSGNWWEEQQFWHRDEWDVEMQSGEVLRIFVQNNEWFLEGAYD